MRFNGKALKVLTVILCLGIGLLAAGFFVRPAGAGNHINNAKGIAINGYDPVAYFQDNKAVHGDAQFQLEWSGVKWFFSSAQNRDLFRGNPQKYAPQYGGNCAWAASQGYVAYGNPIVWKIVDGKLYLNFNKPVQANWEKDALNLIKKGDVNWPNLNK